MGYIRRIYCVFYTCLFVLSASNAQANNDWLPIVVYNLVEDSSNIENITPPDLSVDTSWAQPILVTVIDNAPSNENVVPQITKLPDNGTASVIGDAIKYTPNTEFIGSDTFEYKFNSNNGQPLYSSIGVVTINVSDIERGNAPVANDDFIVTTGEPKAYYIDVVTNDSDLDGDALTVTTHTEPNQGQLEKFSSSVFAYTPNNNICSDDLFSYTIADELNNIATATVYVSCDNSYIPPPSIPKILVSEIRVNSPLNSLQVFDVVKEQYAIDGKYPNSDLKLVLDDPSVEGLALPSEADMERILAGRQDTNSPLGSQFDVINFNGGRWPSTYKGDILYHTNLDSGVGIVEDVYYKLVNPDGQLSEDWGKLSISLDNSFDQNFDYTPTNDTAVTVQGKSVTIDVLANDPNVQSYFTAEVYIRPKNGAVAINSDRTISYTPNPGYSGSDDFQYKVKGNNLYHIDSAPAVVEIQIGEQNQAPIATDDEIDVVDFVEGITYDVIANDTDIENDFIYLLSVSEANFGTVTAYSNRAIKYVPYNGVCRAETFTYVVSQTLDGSLSDIGNVTINCVDLTVPRQFTVPTLILPNTSASLSWQAPLKSGVLEYEVQGELKGRLTKRVFTADTEGIFTYQRDAAPQGKEHCYKVRAWFQDGSAGSFTDSQCVLTEGNQMINISIELIGRPLAN